MTGEYGLPSVRDREGELQAVDHTFTFAGEEITIKILPPTVSQFEEFEEFSNQEDVDPDELEELVLRHLEKPEIPEDESLTFREAAAYAYGIQDHASGGSGVQKEIAEKLEEIDESSGN